MAPSPRARRAPASLKAVAIACLSRREYSRLELQARLLAVAREREAAARAADPAAAEGRGPDRDRDRGRCEEEVRVLLDWLEANGYLSDARFVESRLHARSARHGLLRIRQEMARHGLDLEPEQVAALRETEFARAQEVWRRRFGSPAADARARAAQARFLAARGFPADIVRRVVGGEEEF